jgi:hypothetical protein
MKRHDAYFTALHVAQEARKAAPDAESAFDHDMARYAKQLDRSPVVSAATAKGLDLVYGRKDAGRMPADRFAAMCVLHGLPEPVTEHRFHPTRMWRLDYAWPDRKLALEVEGGIWRQGGGAHSHPLNIQRDMQKYSEAAILGWRVLRVAPEHLASVGLDYARRALA